MKTTIKEITPQWAAQILETRNPNNRRLSEAFVAKLARDIKCNAFVTTHQGIAFDENGDLLDGQHRLAAVVRAGMPITLPVTTGIPTSHKVNGATLNTFELIDGGKPRGVAQMLQMAGFLNATRIAAAVRVSVVISANNQMVALSTAQTHKAISYFRESIELCASAASSGNILRPPSYITGTVAIFHTIHPKRSIEFLREVGDVTGPSGSPSRALAVWAKNHQAAGGRDMIGFAKVAASAIWHDFHGNRVSKLYSNDEAMTWLLSQNKPLTTKLAAIIAD